MGFDRQTVNWVNEEIKLKGDNSMIQKQLRDVSAMVAKGNMDKKQQNKVMGYIRDAINALNKG
jgi:hypothetical protein